MLTSIVSAVVILGLLILVHEAGHFAMAKRCGVRVLRFSIGYPPRLWGFRRGETEYVISATPLGGYVRMLGDETNETPGANDCETLLKETGLDLIAAAKANGLPAASDDPEQSLVAIAKQVGQPWAPQSVEKIFGRPLTALESTLLSEVAQRGSLGEAASAIAEARPAVLSRVMQERSFPTQSVGKRILIVVAGPLANFVFAPIALTLVMMYGVPRLLPIVGEAKPGLPAAKAGLQKGDRLLLINDRHLENWEDLSEAVRGSHGSALKIIVERIEEGSPKREVVTIVPTREKGLAGLEKGSWVIGVMPRGDTVIQRYGPVQAMGRAIYETGSMTGMLAAGFWQIVEGTTPIRQALGGPIMIAQIAGKEAHQGIASLTVFTVMLSVELAIINLFPVPLLDGGHLAFFLVEALRGKPLALRHREMAQRVGLVVLVALMAFVIFNDISRIVQG
jgi:regulator of sigma E protease